MSDTMPVQHDESGPRRRGEGQGTGLIVGAVLILLGVAFFLEQGGYITMTDNWWALFIYLAAVASFANVWRSYRALGTFGSQAGGSLVWGLVLTVVASIFFFQLEWDKWWPVILIAIGAGIVAGSMLGTATRKPEGTGV